MKVACGGPTRWLGAGEEGLCVQGSDLGFICEGCREQLYTEFWGNSSGYRVMGECRRGVGLGAGGTSQPDGKLWGPDPILGEL